MTKIVNVRFSMTFDTGNQAVVDDPRDAMAYCFAQIVGAKLDRLSSGAGETYTLRDRNGNAIGKVETEIDWKKADAA